MTHVQSCIHCPLYFSSGITGAMWQGGRGMLNNDRGSIFLERQEGFGLPTYVIRHMSERGNIANSSATQGATSTPRQRVLVLHLSPPTHHSWQASQSSRCDETTIMISPFLSYCMGYSHLHQFQRLFLCDLSESAQVSQTHPIGASSKPPTHAR